MNLRLFLVSLSALVSLIGCGDDRGGGDASPMTDTSPTTDSSPVTDTSSTMDSGRPADAAVDTTADTSMQDTGTLSCTMGIPRTTVGGFVGDSFPGFELPNCDGENVDFYGDGFCDAPVTVVSFAAGWCGPCIVESTDLTEYLTEPYRAQGVRVIQVLVQKEDASPTDRAYCASWVERFGLTNIEVFDPADELLPTVGGPGGVGLPLTLVIGRDGVIKAREQGVVPELVSLRAAIDEVLAMPTTTVGLGEACDATLVCGSLSTCSPDTRVCVVAPEVLAACDGATPITLAPGTSSRTVSVDSGRGVLTATCGDTTGMEQLFDLTIPEGDYDLVVTTDTPTNRAMTGLDTVLYARNMCLESEGERCNDDIERASAGNPGNLFSTLTITSVPPGVLTLGVELFRGVATSTSVEVSFELRAR